jgi:hypothetical protein
VTADARSHTHSRWRSYAGWLRWYADNWTPAELIPWFKNREGYFVLLRTGIFLGLNYAALWCPVAAVVFAIYFLLDALVVNTTYVFVPSTSRPSLPPIHPLRSALLTIVTYLNVAMAFAVAWLWVGHGATMSTWERIVDAVYQSLRTLATVGPESPACTWGMKLLIGAELLVGIYFVAIILAGYLTWISAAIKPNDVDS